MSAAAASRGAGARHARWRGWELATLAALPAAWLLLPGQALLLNEIAILALFALSLDLILGYAGIVSLGHAAFFGLGAYTAALFAKLVMPDPWLGMAVGDRRQRRCSACLTSVLILRGSDLTRLMVTLGVASILYELANKLDWLTGGADGLQGVVMGPVLTPFGAFEFDLGGRVAYAYTLVAARRLPARRRAASSTRRSASRCRRCATTRCAPPASACRCTRRLVVGLHDRRRDRRRRPARCWRRRPASPRSTCSTSTAAPRCCWCS